MPSNVEMFIKEIGQLIQNLEEGTHKKMIISEVLREESFLATILE
jgi:hypothetical protein